MERHSSRPPSLSNLTTTATCDIFTLSKVLDHSSVTLTEEVYAHPSGDGIVPSANRRRTRSKICSSFKKSSILLTKITVLTRQQYNFFRPAW